MKQTVLSILLALATLMPAAVPLKQAVRAGVARALEVQNGSLDVRSAETAQVTARQNRWGVPTLAGSYRYSSKTAEIDTSLLRLPGLPAGNGPLAAGPHSTTDVKLAFTQPLYTSGVLSGQIAAEESRTIAERILLSARRNEAAGRVKASFHTWRALSARRESLRLLIETLDFHLAKLSHLLNEKQIRKSDVLETRIKIDEARAQLADLDQATTAEAIQFRRLCGHDPAEIEAGEPEGVEPLERVLAAMSSGHPFVCSLDERLRSLAFQRGVVRGMYGPQAQAFAELHGGRPGQNFLGNDWMVYLQAGLAVSVPLFTWQRPRREAALLDYAAEKIANQRRDFLTDAERSLRQLYGQLDALATKTGLYDNLLAAATETLTLKGELYQENQLAHSDYLAAQTDLERYRSVRGELDIQIQIVRVAIHTLAGTHVEEP